MDFFCYLFYLDLVVAMIFSYLKKLNPNKKCLYLSNKMPIIYELTSYLKAQTGLSIFYSNSRNSLKNNVSKFDMADVCMFKIDDFLKVFLLFQIDTFTNLMVSNH